VGWSYRRSPQEARLLSPGSNRRERHLVYGPSNSGKSSTWLAIADWMERTNANNHVYVLDTDKAWEAMQPEDGSLDRFVTVFDLDKSEFAEWTVAANKVREAGGRDDWLVVDMVDKAWAGAQNHYWSKVAGGDSLAEVYFRAQNDDSFDLAGSHGANWGIINKYYDEFFSTVMGFNGHILCVAPAAEVREPNKAGKGGDREEVRRDFGKLGLKPQGQKDLPHAFHTVLLCQETPSGWTYNTVKERGPIGRPKRVLLKGEKVTDFVTSYLFKVAKWHP
jgi:hypothetical protein